MSEDIQEKNIFMMCSSLNRVALTELPEGFHIRKCQRAELGIWKRMHFDKEEEAQEYMVFMDSFYVNVYGNRAHEFYEKTLFVCNGQDQPIATCLLWKAYQEFNTIHWLKVIKGYEGLGIGRALLSIIMKDLKKEEYPIYLHIQPGSYRAIKLYSDFGFYLLSDNIIGNRINELEEGLPFLKEHMPDSFFKELKITTAPKYFLHKLKAFKTIEF